VHGVPVIWRVVSFGLLNIPKKRVTTKDTKRHEGRIE
jgi:hypothetical protein